MSAITTTAKTTSRSIKSLLRTLKKVVFRSLIFFGIVYVINAAYVSILMIRNG
jgi:hypothetical protein